MTVLQVLLFVFSSGKDFIQKKQNLSCLFQTFGEKMCDTNENDDDII